VVNVTDDLAGLLLFLWWMYLMTWLDYYYFCGECIWWLGWIFTIFVVNATDDLAGLLLFLWW